MYFNNSYLQCVKGFLFPSIDGESSELLIYPRDKKKRLRGGFYDILFIPLYEGYTYSYMLLSKGLYSFIDIMEPIVGK